MTNNSGADRAIALLNSLILAGILVVLAMFLVELKHLTNEGKGIYIRQASGEDIVVRSRFGSPVYVKSEQ